LKQARELRKRYLGEAHPLYADSLNNLAMLYQDLGAYGKALSLCEQARDLHKKTRGEAHPHYATSLNNLASLYQALGEYGKALPLLEQARDLHKRRLGEAHPRYANSLHNLALLYGAMGEYGKALPLYEQARDLHKKVWGEAHPHYASSLNNLALLYQDLGAYGKALLLLEQARDLRKRLLGEAHPDYATSLNNLAALYRDLGEHGKALPLLEQARDLDKRLLGEAHPRYATSLNNLAGLYQDLGEYGKALHLFEQARDLHKRHRREAHPHYATSLNNLAALYRAIGEHEKALTLYQQAKDLTKRALGEAHPRYATSLNNLALLYQDTGEYGKALPLLKQTRDLDKRLLGEAHPLYATSLNNLALLYQAMGAYDKALPLFEQAHDLTKRLLGEAHPHYATSLIDLAVLCRFTKDTAKAAKFAEQSCALWQAFFDRTFAAQSSRQRSNLLAQRHRTLDFYLSFALDAGIPPGRLYDAALGWKGALTARQAEERLARDRPELRPLVEQLRLTRAGLARLASQSPASPAAQADWRQRFRRLEAEKEKLEVQLAQESAPYLHSQELRKVTPRKVSDALPAGTALLDLLEYDHWSPSATKKGRWNLERRLLAFVLVRGREPALVDLGPVEPLARALQAWRQALQTYQSPDVASAELSRRVWQPLQQHLAGVQTVLIAPDGVLTGLSFAALPGRQADAYLIEEVALGYVTSGRHLLELALADTCPAAGLLAVGGLAYGEAPKGKPAAAVYKDLAGTRLEAETISRLFRTQFAAAPAPRLLHGAQADVDRLKEALPPAAAEGRPRYLHLATHGFFDRTSREGQQLRPFAREEALPFGLAREYQTYTRNPLLLSGLVLAGANADPDRGLLRAEEVADLDLRGCELAVLSACETGLGKVADTEGVQGLQRAFQAAGARSLVVSLWKVHDAATSVLMEEFYSNLWQKKLSRLEALRQAQLTVLRNPALVQKRQQELAKLGVRGPEDEPAPLPQGGAPAAAARSHPALWAAFILSGDTGPIVEGKP
jgi:CHAT domain-containing protein